jgi:hypothetical protein
MRAFVTGRRSHIRSHLLDLLGQEGHAAVGSDLGLFDGWRERPT